MRLSVARDVGFAGASQFGRTAIQLASLIILARILSPADYGLMAMAMVIAAFAALFRDVGTGAGIVQRESLDDELVQGVFRLNIGIGAALAIGCFALAGLIAQGFSEPQLARVLRTLSPLFLIASAGVVPQALLQRASNFQAIAKAELASALAGSSAGIATAIMGAGVYALVVQTLAATVTASALLFALSRWRPRPGGKVADAKPLLRFSGNLFIFNSLNYAHRNGDNLLIGRFLGPQDLGQYNIAYRILLFPLQNLTFVLGRTLLPAYSRHQRDRSLVAEHYLGVLGLIAFVSTPLMALVWALREPLLNEVLGEQWLPAAAVLAWLAPVGVCQSLVSTSGSALSALGRTATLRNLGMVGVPFLVLSFVLGLPWGIEGIAASYCIANLVWVYPVLSTVLRHMDRSFADALLAIWRPLASGVSIAILIRVMDGAIFEGSTRELTRLALGSGVGMLLYLVGTWLLGDRSGSKLIAAGRSILAESSGK